MKKLYILFFTILISSVSFGQTTDLFFSMYAEGSSNNKFLEIYNGTGSSIDLGASGYSIELYPNGATNPNNTLTFAAGTTVANGDVYVVYNSSADALIQANGDVSASVTFFNGDDAIALLKNNVVIDIIGSIGTDPGSSWAVGSTSDGTKEHTLIRKSETCGPNAVALNSFGTDDSDSEWTVYGQDAEWGQIGSFTGTCSTAGVAESQIEGFAMYPNPVVNGKFTISSAHGLEKNVQIFSIIGKQVYDKTINANEMIDVSNLTSGFYLVRVKEQGNTSTRKLMIQ